MTKQIQTSIEGSRFGLASDNSLVAQGADGNGYQVTPVPNTDLTATVADLNKVSAAGDAAAIGAVAAVTGLACTITRVGPLARLDFTLTDVDITHTDAAGSGSSGSLKLFDFVQGAILPLGSRSNLTFESDTTMDVAGDLAMVYGLGSAAANAGDGALTGTEVDFAAISGTVTFSSNAATSATLLKGAGTPVDGTATAADLYLNESATAATSDANGVLTVNGTISLLIAFLGDD